MRCPICGTDSHRVTERFSGATTVIEITSTLREIAEQCQLCALGAIPWLVERDSQRRERQP